MNQQARTPEGEVLSGLIERIVFHNEDNGFCVLEVHARGQRGVQTVVGHSPSVNVGEWVTASGVWATDHRFGRQFQAKFIKTSEPNSEDGIEKYLASGAIPGIGRVYAEKLVQAFGDKVFDVIESEPERLREVPGIGPKRAKQILGAWEDQKFVREIMVFLHSHGVGSARAASIYKTYGADAFEVMTRDPFQLVRDIRGIGFAFADGISASVGIARDAPVRVRAGIVHALDEATASGHCGMARDELLESARELLDVPPELVEDALLDEIGAERVVEDAVAGRPCVFLARLHRAENRIAATLARLLVGRPPWPAIDADKALPWVERRLDLQLAPSQAEAVRTALGSKVMVITGGPGVGKTTIVQAILRILAAKGARIELCAPTGRAAKRLALAAGEDAKTIHRLLEFDPIEGRFRRNEDEPLECDLLVVDEASMVDVPLMNAVLRALPAHAALLAVGDVDQLPSVGPGQVLADMIGSGVLPVVRLVEVFRQAAESRIIVNAHRINRGELPDLKAPAGGSDFYFYRANDPEDAARKIVLMVEERIPRRFGLDPVREIQVLCPMKKGAAGTAVLNARIQAALNPHGSETVSRSGWEYALGDKVMQIKNDYEKEVFNGDIGFIAFIDRSEKAICVDFDGRPVQYSFGEMDTLVPAYATTIHKSQGSEYPAVVIGLMYQHLIMLERNLLYTAVTRGKQLVVIVGETGAMRKAVETTARLQRCSKLRELLAAAAGS